MPKLLMVTTVAVTIEAFLLPYARHFRASGWSVDAAARGVTGSGTLEREFDGLYEMEWTRNPLDLESLARSVKRIRAIVARNNYDIVHVHTPIAAFITRLALSGERAAGKVKIAYTAHGFHFYKGGPPLKNLIFQTAEKIAARWTDHLVVINGEDYEAALKMLPREKVTYTAGGIGMYLQKYKDAAFGADEIAAARREMGAKPGDTLILTVAEFSPGKRHSDLVKALAKTGDPAIRLAFAGQGQLAGDTRRLAAKAGVAGRIKFLGSRKDVPLLIAAADATALPSAREGLPRVVMESMAIGTPVIGSDIRGTRDLLSGGCGTLVPVGDTHALAEALKKHKNKTPDIAAAAEKARAKAEMFDAEKIIGQYEGIYGGLLNS